MFERFTDRARRSTVLSQEVARSRGDDHIAVWHIIEGLRRESGGVAAQVLNAVPDIETKLSVLAAPPMNGTSPPNIPFDQDAKKVMELSLREALQLGHNYIGTEHILLAVIRHDETGALDTIGVKRKAVIDKISGYAQIDPKPRNQLEVLVTCDATQALREIGRMQAAVDRLTAAAAAIGLDLVAAHEPAGDTSS